MRRSGPRCPKAIRLDRARNLKTRFGLTILQYEQILEDQGGVCAICHEVPTKPCLDHCHKTLVIRGILCDFCNVGLGRFRDNPVALRRAARYVSRRTMCKVEYKVPKKRSDL